MVGPKKQDFWPKINIFKGNHCILRIRGAPVRQKLGMILENKKSGSKMIDILTRLVSILSDQYDGTYFLCKKK